MKRTSGWCIGVFAAIVICVGINGGCSKGDNPIGSSGGSLDKPLVATYQFSNELDYNSAGDPTSRKIFVFYASDQPPTKAQPPFPVLYLLHDFRGDAGYFERYGLQSLLQEMYERGEIGRMLVVTVDASNFFGGSYYRNSATAGSYADIVGATITYVEETYHVHIQAGRNSRAISGHGMGGYGAMRYALDHPEVFVSVSSLSGPLSFGDPNAGTGIWNPSGGMVAMVYSQNGTGSGDPWLYAKLRDGIAGHDTRNFFAMASAFSPHPMREFDSLGWRCIPKFPYRGDCTWVPNQEFYSAHLAGPNTLVFPAIRDTFGVGIDLPFDSTGNLTDNVWTLWRDFGDVKTVFVLKRQQNPTLWSNLGIYFGVGVENEYGYLEQNRDFHMALDQAGMVHTYEEYENSGALLAGHSDQLSLQLRRILKFHSDWFERPTP